MDGLEGEDLVCEAVGCEADIAGAYAPLRDADVRSEGGE